MDYYILILSIFTMGISVYALTHLRLLSKDLRKQKRDVDASNTTLLVLLIVFGIVFLPWLFTSSIFKGYCNTGEIGDTIGGITAPFINGLAAVLVFLAFNAQVRANELVRDQFEKQQVESRFFELVKIHRDNVAEIGIGKTFGRKIFVTLIREFREIHRIVKIINRVDQRNYSTKEMLEISYIILFFGVGPNSTRQLRLALASYGEDVTERIIAIIDRSYTKELVKERRGFNHTPFEGHQSRLGHYYRHLYQTVDYIDSRQMNINKYEYTKALRAQLTTHEQALLYLNSLSPAGKRWWSDHFIIDYRMVQNIPPGFFDPIEEIDIEKEFPENYFEHQED